jgi:hypothetical protein
VEDIRTITAETTTETSESAEKEDNIDEEAGNITGNEGCDANSISPKHGVADKNCDNDDEDTDDCSSDGELFVGDDDLFGIEAGLVVVPVPGELRHDLLGEAEARTLREVPNGCAICLSPFDVEDRVTWSSNRDCKHIFHHDCILDWFKSSGRRHCRRRRRGEQQGDILNYTNNPLLKITRFPKHCPCCRQDFILCPEHIQDFKPVPELSNRSVPDTEMSSDASTEELSINMSSTEDTIDDRSDEDLETGSCLTQLPEGTEDLTSVNDTATF